jgi:hypothetical protein
MIAQIPHQNEFVYLFISGAEQSRRTLRVPTLDESGKPPISASKFDGLVVRLQHANVLIPCDWDWLRSRSNESRNRANRYWHGCASQRRFFGRNPRWRAISG